MVAATSSESHTLDQLDIHTIGLYEQHGYPWAAWDRLREEAPCYWYDREGIAPFWAITRHADVKSIGSNSTSFINGGGRLRIKSLDIDGRYAAAREKKLAMYGWDPAVAEDMVFLDNPAHHAMRQLTVRHFTPARCREMADELAENASTITDEFASRLANGETPDLIHDFAVALPLMTIASMMGVDRDDWADIHRWTDAMFDNESMRFALPGEERRAMRRRIHAEFHGYVAQLIERKRAEPGEDLSSVLVHADIDGRQLTEQELHGYLRLLINAGNETTRNALSRGVLALIDHPDQVDRLTSDPDRFVDLAVDEILRWTTPVIEFARTATSDVDLHGKTIKTGDHVALWYGAANRDPRVFDDPHTFDIGRSPNDHLAFGHGGHFCLGANLAKWELRAAIRALADSEVLQRLERVDEPEWLTDLHVGAYRTALVRYK